MERVRTKVVAALLVGSSLVLVPGPPPAAAAAGDITTFPDPAGPTSTDEPVQLTRGPEGNVWFTSTGTNRIGRITPAGVVTTFPSATIDDPDGIALGPDGNVWFTSFGNDRLGRVEIGAAIDITTFADPQAEIDGPIAITAGPDGNLWFSSALNDRIGRVDPDLVDTDLTSAITTFTDPGGAASTDRPRGIVAGPDGNVWYAAIDSDRIGRITPAGAITTFLDPMALTAAPIAIAAGSDGNLWYTNLDNDRIGRITTTGLYSS